MAARSGTGGVVGRRDPCASCGMPVFIAERLNVGNKLYHRTCFRCARCNNQLSLANCYETETDGIYCCETCPDEDVAKVDITDTVQTKPLINTSLSDEEKRNGLLEFDEGDAADAYSCSFESALEMEESSLVKARKDFWSTHILNEESLEAEEKKLEEDLMGMLDSGLLNADQDLMNNHEDADQTAPSAIVEEHSPQEVKGKSPLESLLMNKTARKGFISPVKDFSSVSNIKSEPEEITESDTAPALPKTQPPLIENKSDLIRDYTHFPKVESPPVTTESSLLKNESYLFKNKPALIKTEPALTKMEPSSVKAKPASAQTESSSSKVEPPLAKTKPPDISETSLTQEILLRPKKDCNSVNSVIKSDVNISKSKFSSGMVDQRNTASVDKDDDDSLIADNVTKENRQSIVKTRMLLFESSQKVPPPDEDGREPPVKVEEFSKVPVVSESILKTSSPSKLPDNLGKYFGGTTKANLPYSKPTPLERKSSKSTEKLSSADESRLSKNIDAVSKYFGPKKNIPEEKFTGSSECLNDKAKIAAVSKYFGPVKTNSTEDVRKSSSGTSTPQAMKRPLTFGSKSKSMVSLQNEDNIDAGDTSKIVSNEETKIESPTIIVNKLENAEHHTKMEIGVLDDTKDKTIKAQIVATSNIKPTVNDTQIKISITVEEAKINDETDLAEDLTVKPQLSSAQNDKTDIKMDPQETSELKLTPKSIVANNTSRNPSVDLYKTARSELEDSTVISNSNDDSLFRINSLDVSSIISTPESKAEYPEDLNPFGDDEEDETGAKAQARKLIRPSVQDLTVCSPVPAARVSKSSNPFGSSDDEEVLKTKPPKVPQPATRRLLEAPNISLNPFWSDGEEPSEEEEDRPMPKPRTSRSSNLATPEPKPRVLGHNQSHNNDRYDSNSSLSSLNSSVGKTPGRKKKPAPLPPITIDSVESSPRKEDVEITPNNSAHQSPKTTPRTRKTRKAPLPPSSTPFTNIVINEPTLSPISADEQLLSPNIIATDDVSSDSHYLTSVSFLSGDVEKEKIDKDEKNRNRQSQSAASSASDTDSPTTTSTPDKSTFGKWKRRKGPAPSRPVPQRRQIKPLPLQQLKQELDIIELQQQGLEKQGVKLEQLIREKCEGPGASDDTALSPDVEEMVLELFELVNEKNELFRRQAELMYLRRQQRLEEEYADLEYQIRCLMAQPERNKTDSDKAREEELINRLVEVVERRNEIVECLEMDRVREAEEDHSINTRLTLIASKREEENQSQLAETPVKLSKKEKKKIKKEKKLKEKGKNVDVDKDIDEMESPTSLISIKEKKKRKWF